VLVAQDRRRVEVFRRSGAGAWERRVHESGDAVELPSLGVAFTTDERYDAAGIARAP
jgi:hypothetical protein